MFGVLVEVMCLKRARIAVPMQCRQVVTLLSV